MPTGVTCEGEDPLSAPGRGETVHRQRGWQARRRRRGGTYARLAHSWLALDDNGPAHRNLDVTDLTLDSGSGGATIALCAAEGSHDVGSGSLRAREMDVTELVANVGSGGVRLSGLKTPKLHLETGSGGSDVELLVQPDDVSIEAAQAASRSALLPPPAPRWTSRRQWRHRHRLRGQAVAHREARPAWHHRNRQGGSDRIRIRQRAVDEELTSADVDFVFSLRPGPRFRPSSCLVLV